MKFFDQKEDVIDLKMTQYGKHLLSKGKFIPKYYAFFDDDVLYDIKWASCNPESDLVERQSDIEDRIQNMTPRTRVQNCHHGVETEIKKINDLVRQKKAELGDEKLQPMASKHHTMTLPLGNSSMSTDKLPSWQSYFLKGRLSESVDYLTGSSPNVRIPQLDCAVTFKVRAFKEGEAAPGLPGSFALDEHSELASDNDMLGGWAGEHDFDDGSFIRVYKDYILLEIEEENTDYLEDNFDIEVYEIKTVAAAEPAPGDTEQLPGQAKGEKEELIPLYFARTDSDLGAVYLTQAPEGSAQSMQTLFPDVDPSYVEYFFEVEVDREIDRSIVCKHMPDDAARAARLTKEFKCPDDSGDGSLSRIGGTLYETEQRDLNDCEDVD